MEGESDLQENRMTYPVDFQYLLFAGQNMETPQNALEGTFVFVMIFIVTTETMTQWLPMREAMLLRLERHDRRALRQNS